MGNGVDKDEGNKARVIRCWNMNIIQSCSPSGPFPSGY